VKNKRTKRTCRPVQKWEKQDKGKEARGGEERRRKK
jgi:hypothetical protein